MVPELPSNYIFFLKACYKPLCDHPVCQRGKPSNPHLWYPSGPPLSNIPFPVPDPIWPRGDQNCTACQGVCSGHFYIRLIDTDNPIMKPPSVILKQKFSDSHGQITDQFIEQTAKEALLSSDETKIWIEHLVTVVKNRKRGATKAAATRKLKRKAQQKQPQPVCSQDH